MKKLINLHPKGVLILVFIAVLAGGTTVVVLAFRMKTLRINQDRTDVVIELGEQKP